MGMFSDLLAKITGHAPTQPAAAPAPPTAAPASPSPQTVSDAASTVGSPSAPALVASAAAAPAAAVDVTGILNGLAAKNPEHLDWKKSIVDLMKLVGMDSSLSARKELAADLHYTGDTSDSAHLNMWLHKEVLKKLAAHGGTVPPELIS